MDSFKKIFAIDLDGTLLSKFKKIKNKDLLYLKKYHDLGGKIVIITGKGIVSGKKYVRIIEEKLNIKLEYASFLSGSIIYDLINDQIISQSVINKEDTKTIFELCQNYHCNFLGISEIDSNEMYYMNHSPITNYFVKKFFIKKRPYMTLKEYSDFHCYKVDIFRKYFSNKKINLLSNALLDKNIFNIAKITKSFHEITLKNVNKELALRKICEILKVDINDTAAIGDSSNDIPMLSIAGISFGIDNKKEDFRKAAKVLIKASTKNPVAWAIENYLLK